MKISEIRTYRLDEFPAMLFLELQTDTGLIGMSENCIGAVAIEAFIHESVAPRILGQDPTNISMINSKLRNDFIGYSGSSISVRAHSSIDIALWDIFGKTLELPIYRVLGGAVRNSIETYNTCAGPGYARVSSNVERDRASQLGSTSGESFEDLSMFLYDPKRLVSELGEMGFRAMKVWPFDQAAVDSGGRFIEPDALVAGVDVIRSLRAAAGSDFKIMLEMHSLWSTPVALKIIEATQEFDIYWYEDAIRIESSKALQQLRAKTNADLTFGETIGTKFEYQKLLDLQVLDHLMVDPLWAGGISESRSIIDLAQTYGILVSPHDCTGPIGLTAGFNLSLVSPNIEFQEFVRAYYFGWYQEIVDGLPIFRDGRLYPSEEPGLGLKFKESFFNRNDLHVKISKL
jgi:L-alanine-DL-glutamate epimerase-like enolase superfamily enzyme